LVVTVSLLVLGIFDYLGVRDDRPEVNLCVRVCLVDTRRLGLASGGGELIFDTLVELDVIVFLGFNVLENYLLG
jgi:hypothetical protein